MLPYMIALGFLSIQTPKKSPSVLYPSGTFFKGKCVPFEGCLLPMVEIAGMQESPATCGCVTLPFGRKHHHFFRSPFGRPWVEGSQPSTIPAIFDG